MQLYYHPVSPFVRKVLIVAAENGLGGRIERVMTDTLDEGLRAVTPLSKIPALKLDDGTVLYDSRVICEYLDALGTGALIPAEGQEVDVCDLDIVRGIECGDLVAVKPSAKKPAPKAG